MLSQQKPRRIFQVAWNWRLGRFIDTPAEGEGGQKTGRRSLLEKKKKAAIQSALLTADVKDKECCATTLYISET